MISLLSGIEYHHSSYIVLVSSDLNWMVIISTNRLISSLCNKDSAKRLTKNKTQCSCTWWCAIVGKKLLPLCLHKCDHNEILVAFCACPLYNVSTILSLWSTGAIQKLVYFGSCQLIFQILSCFHLHFTLCCYARALMWLVKVTPWGKSIWAISRFGPIGRRYGSYWLLVT